MTFFLKNKTSGTDSSVCPLFSCVPFDASKRYVYALGSFDGVHTGHMALLSQTVELAHTLKAVPAVWTFEDSSYKSDSERFFLTDTEQRLALFAKCGIEAVIFENFSSVRDMSPQDFAHDRLVLDCRCAGAVCGFNYRFGAGGCASPDTLRRLLSADGVPLCIAAPVLYDGDAVSSTRIRRAIEEGDCECAAALLGRLYSVRTKVVRGYQLGRTIGIPTVNQIFAPQQLIPRHGVYCAVCDTGCGIYRCVTNIGVRPTVSHGDAVTCESHLIGFDGDLYGRTVEVSLKHFLRPEHKFENVEQLKNAVMLDIKAVIGDSTP